MPLSPGLSESAVVVPPSGPEDGPVLSAVVPSTPPIVFAPLSRTLESKVQATPTANTTAVEHLIPTAAVHHIPDLHARATATLATDVTPRAAVLLIALGCGATSNDPATPPEPRAPADPASTVEDALAGVTADRLRADVGVLADDALRGRATPSEGLDEAAAYIAGRFDAIGLLHVRGAPRYLQTFRCGRGGGPSSNVVGMVPGRDRELRREAILVTAHYDHLGEADDNGDDTIWNGANDNASGVAGMIAIAEALARLQLPPRRSVVFVAFCGEEIGMRGSKRWVRHPLWPLANTTAVVNLEMLGRADPVDPPLVWITGHELSTMPRAFGDGVRFVPSASIGELEADTYDRSDNLPFARAGIVAHTFAAGRLDELYHSVADEADDLDYERMAVIVRSIARGVHRLAEARDAPRWTAAGSAAGYGR
jgi:hypothetical protein